MDYEILLLNFFTTLAKDKPLWFELIGVAVTIGLAAWGYIRAYGAWEKQKKREIELQYEQQRYEYKLKAAQGVWPLLAYFSLWENDKSVFVKRGKQWYFRQKQGDSYLSALPETFFDKGHGVFMPADVKENLYHFRGIIYKILQKTKSTGNENTEVVVKNQNIVKKVDKQAESKEKSVEELRDAINASLRNMLQESEINLD